MADDNQEKVNLCCGCICDVCTNGHDSNGQQQHTDKCKERHIEIVKWLNQ